MANPVLGLSNKVLQILEQQGTEELLTIIKLQQIVSLNFADPCSTENYDILFERSNTWLFVILDLDNQGLLNHLVSCHDFLGTVVLPHDIICNQLQGLLKIVSSANVCYNIKHLAYLLPIMHISHFAYSPLTFTNKNCYNPKLIFWTKGKI